MRMVGINDKPKRSAPPAPELVNELIAQVKEHNPNADIIIQGDDVTTSRSYEGAGEMGEMMYHAQQQQILDTMRRQAKNEEAAPYGRTPQGVVMQKQIRNLSSFGPKILKR